MGKTFRPTGNIAMRAMYAYQKYMSYALDVTDKIFEGGTNRAVSESLNNLKNANLTDDQIAQLAEFAANRRTFKDATWEDWVGDEKKTHGSNLSRAAVGLKKGAGVLFGKPGEIMADTALPFASVPMNVTQTGIDYSAGIAKGIGEAVSIIKDAKAGKEIAVARQRQAASDFGRGLTGVGLVSLFTAAAAAGVMKVNDPKDKDEKALLQAEGRSGAQINWSALNRGLTGGSAEWQDGDVISTVDFLEPFNTHMYLGYELSQEDSVLDKPKKQQKDIAVRCFITSKMREWRCQLYEQKCCQTDGTLFGHLLTVSLLSFRLFRFTLSLPFPELPLAFFAFIVGENIREDAPDNVFDLVLRNSGIVDELFLAAQASCSLRFNMKFLRCGCAWVDDLY